MDAPEQLSRSPAPGPDRTAEPEGFLVELRAGDRVHFHDWGEPDRPGPDGPGVLLVHGLSATAWVWLPVARRLHGRRRTLAIDLPGHGLSDAPTDRAAYAAPALVDALVAVAEGGRILPFGGPTAPGGEPDAPGPGPDEPGGRIVLAGHGFGAAIAALAAERLGPRCAGLVLVDGGWERLADATGLDVDEYRRTIEEPPEVMRSIDAYLADRRDFDPGTWDADQERAARAAVVELPVGRLVAAVRRHALAATIETAFGYDPLHVLPGVSAPIVALVAADDPERRHGRALERAQDGLAAAGRPPIAVTRFDDVGHNLMRYRPDAVVAAILAAGATPRR